MREYCFFCILCYIDNCAPCSFILPLVRAPVIGGLEEMRDQDLRQAKIKLKPKICYGKRDPLVRPRLANKLGDLIQDAISYILRTVIMVFSSKKTLSSTTNLVCR